MFFVGFGVYRKKRSWSWSIDGLGGIGSGVDVDPGLSLGFEFVLVSVLGKASGDEFYELSLIQVPAPLRFEFAYSPCQRRVTVPE